MEGGNKLPEPKVQPRTEVRPPMKQHIDSLKTLPAAFKPVFQRAVKHMGMFEEEQAFSAPSNVREVVATMQENATIDSAQAMNSSSLLRYKRIGGRKLHECLVNLDGEMSWYDDSMKKVAVLLVKDDIVQYVAISESRGKEKIAYRYGESSFGRIIEAKAGRKMMITVQDKDGNSATLDSKAQIQNLETAKGVDKEEATRKLKEVYDRFTAAYRERWQANADQNLHAFFKSVLPT